MFNNDDVLCVCEIFYEWMGIDMVDMLVGEIVCYMLIYVVVVLYCYVFGVFFWYVLLIGLVGVVLYWIFEYFVCSWVMLGDDCMVVFLMFV